MDWQMSLGLADPRIPGVLPKKACLSPGKTLGIREQKAGKSKEKAVSFIKIRPENTPFFGVFDGRIANKTSLFSPLFPAFL